MKITVKEFCRVNGYSTKVILFIIKKLYSVDDKRTDTQWRNQLEKDGITAYIELHIEQGKVLENEQRDIGIVTGIRGSVRRWVRFSGAFGATERNDRKSSRGGRFFA